MGTNKGKGAANLRRKNADKKRDREAERMLDKLSARIDVDFKLVEKVRASND